LQLLQCFYCVADKGEAVSFWLKRYWLCCCQPYHELYDFRCHCWAMAPQITHQLAAACKQCDAAEIRLVSNTLDASNANGTS
jgi:hypothetical protein